MCASRDLTACETVKRRGGLAYAIRHGYGHGPHHPSHSLNHVGEQDLGPYGVLDGLLVGLLDGPGVQRQDMGDRWHPLERVKSGREA